MIVYVILNHLDGIDLNNMRQVNKLFNRAFLEHRVQKKILYRDKIISFAPEWFNFNIVLLNCVIPMNQISCLPDNVILLNCKFENDPVYRDYFKQHLFDTMIYENIHPGIAEKSMIKYPEIISYITLTKENAKRLRLCECDKYQFCHDITRCYNFCRCVPSYLPLLRRQYYFEQYDNVKISSVEDVPNNIKSVANAVIFNRSNRMEFHTRILIMLDIWMTTHTYSENMAIILRSMLEGIRNNRVVNITERSIKALLDHVNKNLNME